MGSYRSSPAHALLRGDLPDNFTRSLYRIAPYKGCGHGCRYCDGRTEKYYVDGDFENDIELRSGLPELLAIEAAKIREAGMVAFGSGVTDPYQPCEASERTTGRCAQILADRAESGIHPRLCALVMTKSALALRDLPAWSRLNAKSGFVLLVSLTSLDERLREIMEPGASPFAARLELLHAFKQAGCTVGVLAMPFLPGLSDGEDSLRALYAACTDIGVDFVMPGGLTLRPGRQKELYLSTLASFHPELLEATRTIYREERPSGSPVSSASRALFERIAPIQREFAIPYLLPHRVFRTLLPKHDELRVLFRDMLELYDERGADTERLRASAERYDAWLLGLRRVFRRRRSLPVSWLEERFAEASRDGELARVLGNERLSRFTVSVVEEGAYLDYANLNLVVANRA